MSRGEVRYMYMSRGGVTYPCYGFEWGNLGHYSNWWANNYILTQALGYDWYNLIKCTNSRDGSPRFQRDLCVSAEDDDVSTCAPSVFWIFYVFSYNFITIQSAQYLPVLAKIGREK